MNKRNKKGEITAVVGLCCNVLMAAAKILAGVLASSISVLADGLNNLTDGASGAITLVGFRLSGAPADKKHPYGHARFEYVSALLIAVIIIAVAFEFLISSVRKLIEATSSETTDLLLITMGASILIKTAMAVYYKVIGNSINSGALKESALDSISDVVLSSVILVSALVQKYTGIIMDGYAGIAAALVMLFMGIKSFAKTLSPLLGEKPPEDFVKRIIKKVEGYAGILGVHDFMAHNYGPNNFYVSLHAEVDGAKDVMQSHDLIDEIERDVASGENVQIVIHMDPVAVGSAESDRLKAIVTAAINEIDPSLSMHDFRAVIGETRSTLIFDLLVPPKFAKMSGELTREIQEIVSEQEKNVLVIINIDIDFG